MTACVCCDREEKDLIRMEEDFALCRKCYDRLYPFMVKDTVLGENSLLRKGE